MTDHFLDLFALDEAVTALDVHLSRVDGTQRIFAVVAMAWQLRQRDYNRSLLLASEAETLLQTADMDETEKTRCKARVRLIRAEFKTLGADLDGGEHEINLALALFEAINDKLGEGDCQWLLAYIWQDRGRSQHIDIHLSLALQHYQLANDLIRVAATQARSMARAAFSDAAATAIQLTELFPDPVHLHDSILTWILTARATVAALTDDPGAAIKLDLQAYQAALNSGQIRHALICAANVAEDFSTLSDLDSALEWAENALSLARTTNWPYNNGLGLMQVGDVLRRLERFDEAEAFLLEAISRLETMPRSRGHINALNHLGMLALDMGDFEKSLSWFLKIEQNIEAQRDRDQLIIMTRGQATALLRLGRKDEAAVKAAEALELANAQGSADEQIKSLRVLAELHSNSNGVKSKNMAQPSAALHYLDQAVKIAKTISGYKVSSDLLNQIANEYATNGDFRSAYEAGLAATAARNNSRLSEAQNRAIAIQVRREMDRTRAETEQHIKLAAALQNTNSTLETLGLIGRKITASLNSQEVLEALHHHADDLLDTWSFIIYLFNEDKSKLQVAFAVETGLTKPFPFYEVSVDNPTSLSARCAREQHEIVINSALDQSSHSIIPGTQKATSLLFAPLMVGQRMLGVMSIQSPNEHAYGERECSIFRTLCAYGAIALDNAAAYSAVDAARERSLIHEQELRIAAIAFESHEGMFITDAKQKILRINSAFSNITGYSSEEMLLQSPSMFKSPQHDDDFYRMVMQTVKDTETWQGEVWTQRKNGEDFPLWLTVTAVRTFENVITNYIFSLVDITDRKLAEDEIRSLAFYDSLTKLPNRRLLTERLKHALATSSRTKKEGALLFIDLDNFKKLNDTRGHDVGDLLLELVGQRLSLCLREGDTAARLGGDEFVVLLEELNEDASHAADLAELVALKIQSELNQPYLLKGKTHHISPSIGVTLFQSHDVNVDDLLKHADLAMYQAKDAGRNTIRFFDPEMQKAVDRHAALEADLRQALESQQFVLHYQIQMDSNDQIIGAEALIRWNHPERGMVSPSEFISVAEENGLILPLGDWILDTACKQLHIWSLHPDTAHLSLAVNISARQFHDAHFVNNVMTALRSNNADPYKLKIELTESLLLKDIDAVISKMRELMLNGVRFSLDDFGTGYSSLAYLKRLPLEQLKIDQTFVRDIFIDSNDLAIVRAIVTLGLSMGLGIIAEGVETAEQREFLQSCGCSMFQGYLFGRPTPVELLNFNKKVLVHS
ncbi:EAL domain-containing protein [Solimicrobium silvestre]|uniref:GGDEF: diguanylate cyclase (GGDEF) domain n=1 Tax=Solimicrobium silvestre TaxID=2099400 RepID=A0A2S9H2M7_9BURK|nr:EAL domain-containing protein [Solimicrobium silvestre]PRC94218.1 GGDEF: diguanylate cyclase (GGDEF) domain [Solimicrobium silvestre]